MSRISLLFSAFAPSLRDQLAEQGVTNFGDADSFDHFQKDNDAIARLYLRGIMRESEADRMRRALLKNIVKFLTEATAKASEGAA